MHFDTEALTNKPMFCHPSESVHSFFFSAEFIWGITTLICPSMSNLNLNGTKENCTCNSSFCGTQTD